MGLFDSDKVKWRRRMQADPACSAKFNLLANLYGRENAKQFLEVAWMWANANNMLNIIDGMVPDVLQREHDYVCQKKQWYNQLAADSYAGTLRTELNNNLRPEADYYKNPGVGANPTARDLAIDKAANWICGTYTAALQSTRDLLKEYIPATGGLPGKAGGALGVTTQHLDRIHKKIVPNEPAYRFGLQSKGVRYPTTVGGRYLLDDVIRSTGTTGWPTFQHAAWEDIAMFYLAAIVTVQGYPDGNKRTGHFAYAMVLIKGTHGFKAPTMAKEKLLFRMQG